MEKMDTEIKVHKSGNPKSVYGGFIMTMPSWLTKKMRFTNKKPLKAQYISDAEGTRFIIWGNDE